MQKYTQKWTLIKLLELVDEGSEFFWKNWPLHVTLVDTFAVDWEKTNLFEKLSALLAKQKPVEVVAGDDEYFGPQKQIQVTTLKMTPELQSLHNDIIALFKSVNAVFNEPQYVGEGFVAHSTVQKHARLHKGDIVKIDELTIVDMFPHGDGEQRKLLRTIKFSE